MISAPKVNCDPGLDPGLDPKTPVVPITPRVIGTGAAHSRSAVAASERVVGLDAIRFVCALWVVFSHFGFIPLGTLLAGEPLGLRLLRGLYSNLFCGVAAVIVFFVISGFCIHFPFRTATAVPIAAFLARRYLRIGIPLAVAIFVVAIGQGATGMAGFYSAILWSLVAELIYYTFYPALFPLLRRSGWSLVAASYLLALLLTALHPKIMMYQDFGPYVAWIVGLPCWLLGCMLAESFSSFAPPPTRVNLWLCRCGVWFLASLFSVLRFHAAIGYPLTLNFFAIVCFFWLRLELRWFKAHPPPRSLERAGAWSYSLYLCHVPMLFLVGMRPVGNNLNSPYNCGMWSLQIAACLLLSYLFFRLVERPAHRIARKVGLALQ